MRADHRIVLVRRGRFRRRADGRAAHHDSALAYVGRPGQQESFAHPAGGDVCTAITIGVDLWSALVGPDARLTADGFRVEPAIDLAHRRLLAAEPDIDYAVAERLVHLTVTAFGQIAAGPMPATDATRADRAVVAAACEAIGAGHPAAAGLIPLAGLLGRSPYRLSRAFSVHMGVSLTRYRNRVRAGWALDRIEAGEQRLGRLAAELGFADQAHLTRTIKQHYGHTPTALRDMLGRGADRRP